MAVSIPTDVLQFFGMALRMAQELAYLYGEPDLWEDGQIDDDKVRGQLIMYSGVMFGVSGASAGVRLLSSQLAKQTLKKLPQKALTKTIWYPIVKQVGKAIGVKVTKTTVASGISKTVPIVGGVISGGLNFATMLPMGNRLADTLEEAHFGYTDKQIEADFEEVSNLKDEPETDTVKMQDAVQKVSDSLGGGLQKLGGSVSGLFAKASETMTQKKTAKTDDPIAMLEKLAALRDSGVITQEDFDAKKAEILSKI